MGLSRLTLEFLCLCPGFVTVKNLGVGSGNAEHDLFYFQVLDVCIIYMKPEAKDKL